MILESTKISFSLPTFCILLSWMARKTFDWADKLISPISSKKIVPLLAASNLPTRSLWADVKEPFRCPNSSLSINSEGIAAQLTSINGPSDLKLLLWICLATNSFPDPFGPKIITLAFVGEIFSIICFNSFIFFESPTISYLDCFDVFTELFLTFILFFKDSLTEDNKLFKSGGFSI